MLIKQLHAGLLIFELNTNNGILKLFHFFFVFVQLGNVLSGCVGDREQPSIWDIQLSVYLFGRALTLSFFERFNLQID